LIEKNSPPADDILNRVLDLAKRGLETFPVWGFNGDRCACGLPHKGSNDSGKHPQVKDWPNVATTDPATLESWFKGHEDLNYGIYAEGSGLIVFDIDVQGGGWEQFYRLDATLEGIFPETVEVQTGVKLFGGQPQRGAHKYFKAPSGYKWPSNLKAAGAPNVDIRYAAYVVGPGSMHYSGTKYEWLPGHAPWEMDIAELPIEVAEALSKKGYQRKASEIRTSTGDEDWESKWETLMASQITNTAYARKALLNTCAELKKMKSGQGRNNALNAKCYSLGRLIGGRQLDYCSTKDELRNAMKISYGPDWIYKEEKIDVVLRDWGGGFESGAREPLYATELSEQQISWVASQYSQSDDDQTQALLEIMQMGFFDGSGKLNLDDLIAAIKSLGPIAVGPGMTIWHYNKGYWRSDGRSEITSRIHKLLGNEARPTHTQAVLHFVEVEEQAISNLGPDQYLNVVNGMLHWKTGHLSPHSPEHYSTIQLNTWWNPEAVCPTVDKFFSDMIHEDLHQLMWEIIGICLFSGIGFPVFIILDGSGRNGKGTLLNLIEKLIPKEFVAAIELQALGKDKFAAASLYNKILNKVGDLSPQAMDDTGLLKQLTGGDLISAQFKFGQPFSFVNQATLIFAANKIPATKDSSKGFVDRLLIIPFDKRALDVSEIDETLGSRMAEELPGVLVKAVEGLRRAKARGYLEKVPRCEVAREMYLENIDSIESWAAARIYFTDSLENKIERSELYVDYEVFCGENSMVAVGKSEFYKEFASKFTGRTRGVKGEKRFFNRIVFAPVHSHQF
jgi:putative DNA primase/helicase